MYLFGAKLIVFFDIKFVNDKIVWVKLPFFIKKIFCDDKT